MLSELEEERKAKQAIREELFAKLEQHDVETRPLKQAEGVYDLTDLPRPDWPSIALKGSVDAITDAIFFYRTQVQQRDIDQRIIEEAFSLKALAEVTLLEEYDQDFRVPQKARGILVDVLRALVPVTLGPQQLQREHEIYEQMAEEHRKFRLPPGIPPGN